MNAVGNLAALQTGTKSVSGGVALFGRDIEEIDINFDGIRAESQKSSEAMIKAIEQTCSNRQQTGVGLRNLVCVECAADFIHDTKFKARLNAINQKNLAKIRTSDTNWQSLIDSTRAVRDLSVDAFFTLGAIAFPMPVAWKSGEILVKGSITYFEQGTGKAATGVTSELARVGIKILPVPKHAKVALEFLASSAKDTANAMIDGTPLADAVIDSLLSNVADSAVKKIVNTGEFRAWLSKKAIPVRVERNGYLDAASMLSKDQRKALVEETGKLAGKGASKFGKVAIGSVHMTNGSVKPSGEGGVAVNPDQFQPIAKAIIAAVG
jgi:hypothetical protein